MTNSGKPASGYDTATLVADLKGFLDVMRLHDTNHVFFQDPKQVDKVVREIRDFLTSWKETRP